MLRIGILTNEYPPHVYGGAGVHVDHLTRALVGACEGECRVQILCFGEQRVERGGLHVLGVRPPVALPARDPRHAKLFATLLQDLVMSGTLGDIDVVHCHTWYTHLAGCLVKQLHDVPLVLTTHSLEPHRPWKAEQLGTAYNVSTWIERTAYRNADGVVAVSDAMREDVRELYGVPRDRVRVIHNGIDLERFAPIENAAVLRKYGIDPDRPYVLFVGRITRQKGIIHLVHAIRHLRSDAQVVLCAGAPDTTEIAVEMTGAVAEAQAAGTHDVVWVREMVPVDDLVPIYTHAFVFVCPSVYEPFGIINLEAMACETPVVASAVGGIPEVVQHGETGFLVPFDAKPDGEPIDPEQFSRDLASEIDRVLADDDLRRAMGRNARARVEHHFGWSAIARQTLEFYKAIVARSRGDRGQAEEQGIPLQTNV